MNLEVIDNKIEWEKLLDKHPDDSFLQSWEWANFQEYGLGKKVYRSKEYGLCIVEGSRFGNILYMPRGPLVDWEGPNISELLRDMVSDISDMGFFALRIDPPVPYNSTTSGKIREVGLQNSRSTMQVQNAWILELNTVARSQDLFDVARSQGMNKKLPGEIKRSRKKGLNVKIMSGTDDIDILIDHLNDLSLRKDFKKRDDDYYRKQWKYMSESGKEKLFVAFYEDNPIASALVVFDKREGSYLHAGSLDGYSNLYAPATILWRAVEYSKEIGCERFNFWGVIEDTNDKSNPGYGYSKFKMRFGGRVEKYIGTMDYPIDPIKYSLIKLQDGYRALLYAHR